MKATIASNAHITSLEAPDFDQFGCRLYGNDGLFHEDTITVRTARVFAAELKGTSAFMTMMAAIAEADPRSYESLVGKMFSDADSDPD